jgi:cation-transporting P-type ATPase E
MMPTMGPEIAPAAGLTDDEVAERVRDGRVNTQPHRTTRSVASILRENIVTLFNGILTACFVVLAVLGDLRDGLFFGIVIANAAIGIVQELRAKRVLDRTALLLAPHARVRRNGAVVDVPIGEVVLDDVVVLTPGDQIAADARVLESSGLTIDESMLTGESDPVEKTPGDTLLSGSHVSGGAGAAVVTAVGADSYASRLTSQLKRHTRVFSELQHATNRVLVYISILLGPLVAIIVIGRIVLYSSHSMIHDDPVHRAAIDVVASVVSVIPEGLVLLTSLAFGAAAIELAARKVLVQEPAAVEVLARVDVLCLDKTGTLTTGELRLERVIALEADELDAASRSALAAFGADEAANATARVLAEGAASAGTVVRRIPFGSDTKMSGLVLHEDGAESHWVLGAPERVLVGDAAAAGRAADLAATGLRVLALARAAVALPDRGPLAPAELRLTSVALVVISETVRPEAADSLAFFRAQGVRVVILSGDSPATVGAIARSVGFAGTALDASGLGDDEALAAGLETADVLGRVSPEQKTRAVELLQRAGRIVAMTGDGVNDATALKTADLGVAMGDGTPATKAASRVVLLDNGFHRLPGVLAAGRRVIANVERVANLFLSKTAYGIVLAIVSAVAVWPFPFAPRQLSLVSTLAIGIPSFFLALAPNARRYTPGVLGRVLRYSIPTGVVVAATVIAAYALLLATVHLPEARTGATIALYIPSLWVLCVLSRPLSWWRIGLMVVVTVLFALAFVIPAAAGFLELRPLPVGPLLLTLAIGAVGAALIELVYRIARGRGIVFDRE